MSTPVIIVLVFAGSFLALAFVGFVVMALGRLVIDMTHIIETQGQIMAQIDDLSTILDAIMTDVDQARAHAVELETELSAAQKQIDANQAPDLSMVLAKATAIRTALESTTSTVSVAQGASAEPSSPQSGDAEGERASVGDAAEGTVVQAGTTGGETSQAIGGDDVGTMPAEITSGTVDASASGTSHDTEATSGSQSAGDAQAAGSVDGGAITSSDPEAQARDPNQG